MANILHLCNDFLGSRIYERLYQHLHNLGYSQTVFVPTRGAPLDDLVKKENNNTLPYKVVYSSPLKRAHRLIFELKRRKLREEVFRKVNVSEMDLVHATTLFSDGAIAYDIHIKFGVPYIVTVRSTDISIFLKHRPDLVRLAFKILRFATRVIFVSSALQKRFFANKGIQRKVDLFREKCEVIPNGIDEFWINNIQCNQRELPRKILYVGTLIPRKNALALANAVLTLKSSYPNLELTIVGEGGAHQKNIEILAGTHANTIRYLGKIGDRDKLISVFREHDIFAMPSYNETFGLVYIEALSQGLPILYSCDDGVDGLIPSYAGCSVDAHSQESITEGVDKMLRQYKNFDLSCFDFARFDWENIAKRYKDFYIEALSKAS